MISTTKHTSLSRTFRVSSREYGAINYLRYRQGLNIAHIADLAGRSLATVHRVLSLRVVDHVDNRGQTKAVYQGRARSFAASRALMRLQLKTWLRGFADTVIEAFEDRTLTAALIRLLTENSEGEDDAEPG